MALPVPTRLIVEIGLLIVAFECTILPLRRTYALWKMVLLTLSLFFSLLVACAAFASVAVGVGRAGGWLGEGNVVLSYMGAATFAVVAACFFILAALRPSLRRLLAAVALGALLEAMWLALYGSTASMEAGASRVAASVLALLAVGAVALLVYNSISGGQLLASRGVQPAEGSA